MNWNQIWRVSFSAAIIFFLAGCPYIGKPGIETDAAIPSDGPPHDVFSHQDGEIDAIVRCNVDSDCDDGNSCTDNYCTAKNVCESRSVVWQLVSSGAQHTCGLTEMGKVKCWGSNKHGQLGNGSDFDRFAPVDVVGLDSQVTMISAGLHHSCALTFEGGVKCWGSNANGQLGNGTVEDSNVAAGVAGIEEGVSWISAGLYHTCAVTVSGDGFCWGDNRFGQLGDGATDDSLVPVKTAGTAVELRSISAGYNHTCAVTVSGNVKCWGDNSFGALGTGDQESSTVAVDVEDLSSEATFVTTGLGHTCALTTDGGVKCWGSNTRGELGDGEGGPGQFSTVPKDVTGLTSGVQMVTTGHKYTCVLTSGGGVMCWGSNTVGQLGDGTVDNWRSTPEHATGLEIFFMDVSAGTAGPVEETHTHTCAVMVTGKIFCWGDNIHGQAGDGTAGFSPAPVRVSGQSNETVFIASGEKHNCLMTEAGTVQCWGENSSGQLGNGSYQGSILPAGVTGMEGGATGVAAGNEFSCAAAQTGGVRCWGANDYGQLGNGTINSSNVAVEVADLNSEIISISAGTGDGPNPGGSHVCAADDQHSLWCWGLNNYGQLGDSTTTNRSQPTMVTGLSENVAAVSAGYGHTCLLTVTGNVKCFGRNDFSQLGDGTTQNRHNPVEVGGLPSEIAAMSSGAHHTCAVTSGGAVYCWGRGIGSTPLQMEGLTEDTLAVAAGYRHSCALKTGGSVLCWGENTWGEAGSDAYLLLEAPSQVDGLSLNATAISVGLHHSCAITGSKEAWCWGSNMERQLGKPDNSSKPSPVIDHCSTY